MTNAREQPFIPESERGTEVTIEQRINQELQTVGHGLDVLSEFAVLQGVDPNRLRHLAEVCDRSAYEVVPSIPPDRHGEPKLAGLTSATTGKVVISLEALINPQNTPDLFLHESVHRAEILSQGVGADDSYLLEVVSLTNIPLIRVNEIWAIDESAPRYSDLESAEQKGTAVRKDLYVAKKYWKIVVEGMAEGLVVEAKRLFALKNGYLLYRDSMASTTRHGRYIIEKQIFERLVTALTKYMSPDRARADVITLGLTGEIHELVTKVIGEDLLLQIIKDLDREVFDFLISDSPF